MAMEECMSKKIILLFSICISLFIVTACNDSSSSISSGSGSSEGGSINPPEVTPTGKIVGIYSGGSSSQGVSFYAVYDDGSLYAWGKNNAGQLGVGDTIDRNTPTKVTGISGKIRKLIPYTAKYYYVSDFQHVLALMEDGSLYSWGYNGRGQLGVGDYKNKNTPAKVNLNGKVVDIYSAGESYLALMEDGSLYAWGENNAGQLGVGDTIDRNTPTKVTGLNGKIKKIIMSNYDVFTSSYALMEDGTLYGWGSNNAAQLCDALESFTPEIIMKDFDPVIATDIAAGYGSLFLFTQDKGEYTCGKNNFRQLGTDYASGGDMRHPAPTTASINNQIARLFIFDGFVYGILKNNMLFSWGRNEKTSGTYPFMLGRDVTFSPQVPGQVPNISGNVADIIVADDGVKVNAIYAVMEDGSLYAWGFNGNGALGISNIFEVQTPQKVNGINGKVKKLIPFTGSILALLEDGSLYSWGKNDAGQLGVGDKMDKNTPTKVNINGKIVDIIIYNDSVLALLDDGSLYAWGKNDAGQLGVGDTVDRNTPTKIDIK